MLHIHTLYSKLVVPATGRQGGEELKAVVWGHCKTLLWFFLSFKYAARWHEFWSQFLFRYLSRSHLTPIAVPTARWLWFPLELPHHTPSLNVLMWFWFVRSLGETARSTATLLQHTGLHPPQRAWGLLRRNDVTGWEEAEDSDSHSLLILLSVFSVSLTQSPCAGRDTPPSQHCVHLYDYAFGCFRHVCGGVR